MASIWPPVTWIDRIIELRAIRFAIGNLGWQLGVRLGLFVSERNRSCFGFSQTRFFINNGAAAAAAWLTLAGR